MSATCHSCGHRNIDEAEFCQSCGVYMNWVQTNVGMPPVDAQPPRPSAADPASEPLDLSALPRPSSRTAAPPPRPSPSAFQENTLLENRGVVSGDVPVRGAPPRVDPRWENAAPAPPPRAPRSNRRLVWIIAGAAAGIVLLVAATVFVLVVQPSWPPFSSPGQAAIGEGTIPAGSSEVVVIHEALSTESRVFLTPDTGRISDPTNVEGLRITALSDGSMTISTLDGTLADAERPLPFDFLIVNEDEGTLGQATYISGFVEIPAGAGSVTVPVSGITGNSAILLTVDSTGGGPEAELPGIQVSRRESSWFRAAYLPNKPIPAAAVRFNWLVVNLAATDDKAFAVMLGRHEIKTDEKEGQEFAYPPPFKLMFVTVDSTGKPSDAIDGLFVVQSSKGKFRVTTMTRDPAQRDVGYSYLIIGARPDE